MKKVFKKYFYYVEVLEFVGYMGIYILAVVPFILVIIYFTFDRELINDNPSGNSLFSVIGKAFFSTCICDLCLFYILKYFSLKITCKLMIINLSIIYLIFYLATGKRILSNYYFLIGQIFSVILLFLLFKNVYEKNLKREVFEMNKIKLSASII
jgi:drug/metabolite transporter (DMT)-like permease